MSFYKFLPGVVLFILLNKTAFGQSFYRIECDISIKSKTQGGQGNLTLGKVFYDRTIKKMVYDITFPEKEVWVVKDSLSIVYREGSLFKKGIVNPFIETTVFHKCLEGKLNDFGLKSSPYQIEKVEKDGDMVITTWKPPTGVAVLGQIATSTVNNSLYGVVIKDALGEILSKQVYKNYVLVNGLKVPSEIIQVMFKDGTEIYQVITLSNIAVNSIKNENMYNYSGASN